jgi:hypothetical protein
VFLRFRLPPSFFLQAFVLLLTAAASFFKQPDLCFYLLIDFLFKLRALYFRLRARFLRGPHARMGFYQPFRFRVSFSARSFNFSATRVNCFIGVAQSFQLQAQLFF